MGLTESQARKILDLARKLNAKARVRSFQKGSQQHAGRAFLIEVLNRHQALIQPFGHRKQERVELSSLAFWKSGNDFDLPEEEKETVARPEQVQTQQLVIYSPQLNKVWGGNSRRWMPHLYKAEYFATENSALPLLEKLQQLPNSKDACLLTAATAHGELQKSAIIVKSTDSVEQIELAPIVKVQPANTVTVQRRSTVVNNCKTDTQASISVMMKPYLDFDVKKNQDRIKQVVAQIEAQDNDLSQRTRLRSDLLSQIEQRMQRFRASIAVDPNLWCDNANPCTDAKELNTLVNQLYTSEVLVKQSASTRSNLQKECDKLLTELRSVMQVGLPLKNSVVKTLQVKSSKKVKVNKSTPRGVLSRGIFTVLTQSSRLDRNTLVLKISGHSPLSSKKSIIEGIRTFCNKGYIVESENGYSLTQLGRDVANKY